MMKFRDVSNWVETYATSTKGTRDKLVLLEPGTEDTYFLKFPMNKPGRDYTPENWSEVIAYELGNYFGFDVLEYNLAAYRGKVGCISKNMVRSSANELLVEGHSILSRYDDSYDPGDKNTYNMYTFDFVKNSIVAYGMKNYVADFIKILVFDAIIGNSDRHQSNWGIIQASVKKEERKNRLTRFIPFVQDVKMKVETEYRPAPIYDSGCCLGREHDEGKLLQMLESDEAIDKYVRKGTAELRIARDKKKCRHDELLSFIKNTDHGEWRDVIETEISRVVTIYKEDEIRQLIYNTDEGLPDEYKERYGLTMARKEFICRVIGKRIKQLKNV